MPELEKLTVRGFKSIKDVSDFSLGPINVLIGSNGSGKSNVLSVFSFLREIKEGRLVDYVRRSGGAERVLHFGSKNTEKLEIALVFEDELNQYRVVFEPTADNLLFPSHEVVYFWDKRFPRPYNEVLLSVGAEAGISNKKLQRVGSYVRNHFDRWRTYHFHDTSSGSPLKKASKVADNEYLRADGSNLSAFLYLLEKKYPDCYGQIRSVVQRVFPAFMDFQLKPDRLNEEFISLEWKHRNSDAFFDASSFSDGTLRFIALATLFLQPEELRPSVVIVDEPELGLHPFAIGLLAALVKQASVSTQVILSTQSPFLLDHFEVQDVIVADLVQGVTSLSRLDPERLSIWLESYSLGQLWEKNEIGGRPSPGGQS